MALEILAGLVILIGVVGTVIPLLPGVLLVGIVVGIWAYTNSGWWLLVLAVLLTSVGLVAKYLLPARTARDEGSTWALAVGSLLSVIGFFVIPVIGFVIGFMIGVFVAEVLRIWELRSAWKATWATLKSVGIAMAIEFVAAGIMAVTWFGAVVLT
jgi:uncharacterized protein YqgC (DUF456 family)